ncbi:MAG: S8 family serine peptidase [Nitrosopumilus sp.]|nr:S8 family serine peptidase [Nitrosopumilus sp.]
MKKISFVLLIISIIILPNVYAQELDSLQEANLSFSYQHAEGFAQLETEVEKQGEVRVIIALDVVVNLEGEMESPQAIQSQQQMIQSAQQEIIRQLTTTNAQSVDIYQFKHIPYISTTINLDSLNILQSSPMVSSIMQDVAVPLLLYQSNTIIGADKVWLESFEEVGYTGAGQQIAVLDTGVDKNHPFLIGKIVSEACFSSNVPSEGSTSLCPGGVSESTAPNSGSPCPSSIAGCDHGTHVAGIAAGGSFLYVGNEYHGVVPDAQIISIKVFSQFNNPSICYFQTPCVLSYTSDQMKALEKVLELSQEPDMNIASVNMSLGGGRFNSVCDDQPLKPLIDQLRSVGVATVIASGNNGFSDSISAPACISSAISVGSTTKSDYVSSFSNSANILDILAPGSSIISSILNNQFAAKSGTSMATPHVAGAWALVKEKMPNATVQETLDTLKNTGTQIQDDRNGLTFSRIQLDETVKVIPEFPMALLIFTIALMIPILVVTKGRFELRYSN